MHVVVARTFCYAIVEHNRADGRSVLEPLLLCIACWGVVASRVGEVQFSLVCCKRAPRLPAIDIGPHAINVKFAKGHQKNLQTRTKRKVRKVPAHDHNEGCRPRAWRPPRQFGQGGSGPRGWGGSLMAQAGNQKIMKKISPLTPIFFIFFCFPFLSKS